jgi:membrane protease YdiL (CAAX protease family)
VFIHGVGGLTMFPVVFVVGLVFAAIFLWRRSLAPAMVVHALLDLTLLGS